MSKCTEDLARSDDPQVTRLRETFLAQIKSAGRAHHRALLAEMRKGRPGSATEPMQEFALALKGKLGFLAPKAAPTKPSPAAGETLAYYPGCLTTESAREYDATIRLVAREVGLALEEISGWGCCGGGFDSDEASALVKRNVERAGGRTITSGCPLCIAETRKASPGVGATHLLGILARPDILAKIAERVKSTGEKRPVGSLKVSVLYGCELADPAVYSLPSPLGGEGQGAGRARGENPSPQPSPPRGEGGRGPIESLMETAGARVVPWAGRNRCCGGYLLYADPEAGFEMLRKIFRDFEEAKADAIVTACPHCHFNLDAFQFALGRARKRALEVPVLHFTEVLALAMNLDVERELDRHVTSLFPLIERLVIEEEKRQTAEALETKKAGGSLRPS